MIQDTIKDAITQIFNNRLGEALHTLRPVFEEHRKLSDAGEFEDIWLTFRTMLDYMRRNADDPGRKQLYDSLLKRTYRVAADLGIAWRCRNVGFYITQFQKAAHLNMSHDFLRTVLETYVSDQAMLSLDAGSADRQSRESELYNRHQTFIERLFASIAVSCQWKDGDRKFWQQMLISPTIDNGDALVIVSAITLSAMNQFDMNKLQTLANVYMTATDTALKERALIGFVLSVDEDASQVYHEEYQLAQQVALAPGASRELLELQKQIVYCMNADRDTRKINEEIMPELTRNAPFRVGLGGNIEEKEYDRMREILHPDADDKAMDDIEKSMKKISDMQKQGADVYFGGFSQMKRFPFFSETANWFMPFSIDHPALRDVKSKLGNSPFMNMILNRSSFCESDKYSFTLAVATILDRMPPNLREMMTSAQATGIDVPEEEVHQPAFIRRLYLQDLYRFFNLHPQRGDLQNPFDMKGRGYFFANQLFMGTELDRRRPDLAVFFYDDKRYDDLEVLLCTFSQKQQDTLTFWLLHGKCLLHEQRYAEAGPVLEHALKKDPDNEIALRGLMRAAVLAGRNDVAEETYAHLLRLHPGNRAFLLGRGIALINLERIDEGAEFVYEADYRYPNDDEVRRVKAWMFMWQNKFDEAIAEYNKLVGGQPIADDYINMGYALWISGDLGGASRAFVKFLDMKPDADLYKEMCSDEKLLKKYNITDDDMSLMEELVYDSREEDER